MKPLFSFRVSPAQGNDDNKDTDAPWKTRRPQGWRATVALGSLAAATILIINIALLGWASSMPKADDQGNVSLFTGDCNTSARISTWSHLGINILSTLLLAASNNAMQGLSAPTRQEVDKAHAKGRWVNIGVASLRNLRTMGSTQRLVWISLALSSIPLHLLYNAVIYSVLAANDYYILTASKSFVDNSPWNRTQAIRCNMPPAFYAVDTHTVNAFQQQASSWRQLDTSECIKAYGQQFVTQWANVVLILNTNGTNDSDSFYGLRSYSTWAENWICGRVKSIQATCNTQANYSSASSWTQPAVVIPDAEGPKSCLDGMNWAEDLPVEYCLAQPVEPACTVGFNIRLMSVVVACNIAKLVCLLWAFWIPGVKPLLTIGDAIESFMNEPDSHTVGQCTLSVVDIRRGNSNRTSSSRAYSVLNSTARPKHWRRVKRRWRSAASAPRWFIANMFFFLTWAFALVVFIQGGSTLISHGRMPNVSTLKKNFASASDILSYGIGKSSMNTLIRTGITTLAGNVLLANAPQLLISFLYLFYNDLFTNMLLAHEWNSYAKQRKALRVSVPHGEQRSTYFLQLPYRYSIPLMIASGLLHWAVSQSIFIVLIEMTKYDSDLRPQLKASSTIGCGWSPLGIILAMALGLLVVLVLWGLALFRTYDGSMPLASSCSLAISAACHPASTGTNDARAKLMWGAVTDKDIGEDVGHACFSSGRVEPLQEGGLYS